MYRDIFTNKWVLGGISFLILFAGLCYLYYHQTTAPYREQAAELDKIIQRSERQRTAKTAKRTERAADASAESNTQTAEKPVNEATDNGEVATPVTKNTAPTQAQNEEILAAMAEGRVSPYGFGPYPKIPDGWPQGFFDRELTREHELLGRVRIKLHEQGIPTLGVGIDKTGMVYPFDKDQVYITFGETYLPSLGHVRYIADIFGDATVSQQIASNTQARNPDMPIPLQIPIEADIPAGVQVLDKSEGFDPYEFLNLKRQ